MRKDGLKSCQVQWMSNNDAHQSSVLLKKFRDLCEFFSLEYCYKDNRNTIHKRSLLKSLELQVKANQIKRSKF